MDFLGELKEKKILSQRDIDNFKSYIDKKYGTLEDAKKYTILKNSITYVVDRDLTEFKIDKKEDFVNFLVEKVLLEDKEDLFADKIFEKVISEGQPSDSLLQNLTKWINKKIKIPLEKEMLESYYHHNYFPRKSFILEESSTSLYPNLFLPKTVSWLLWGIIVIFSSYSMFSLLVIPDLSHPVAIIEEDNFEVVLPAYVLKKYQKPNRNFPHYLYYRDIHEENLKNYLASRNSLLESEPYFSQLLATAKEFDLNPLLLFAITGHEQAFVPKDHPNSETMIHNPFNVFGSWQRYNTNLKETSEIAARTIFNSLGDLPAFIDPFFWMNRKYAEDSHWWKGVRAIFWHLEKDC